jgi:Au+-exporting ATPase
VIEGDSYVDEAMITGEPVPVAKAPGTVGDRRHGEPEGRFCVPQATAVGADTVLAQIIRMVEEAQGGKLPIQAMVDRVTMWFVPAVMAVAALTFVVWLAFRPVPRAELCAGERGGGADHRLPLRDGAGDADLDHGGHRARGRAGRAVPQGRGAATAEGRAGGGLDKTGTLTEGKPALTDLDARAGRDAPMCWPASRRSRRSPNTPSPAPS